MLLEIDNKLAPQIKTESRRQKKKITFQRTEKSALVMKLVATKKKSRQRKKVVANKRKVAQLNNLGLSLFFALYILDLMYT